jgi:hypothetical protein
MGHFFLFIASSFYAMAETAPTEELAAGPAAKPIINSDNFDPEQWKKAVFDKKLKPKDLGDKVSIAFHLIACNETIVHAGHDSMRLGLQLVLPGTRAASKRTRAHVSL